jgi:hypothetical protein
MAGDEPAMAGFCRLVKLLNGELITLLAGECEFILPIDLRVIPGASHPRSVNK